MIYSVTPQLYREALGRLCDAVGPKNYFTGTVLFPAGDLYCRFVVTAIVYRRMEWAPEGVSNPIEDLIPVWWEFHTLMAGEEQLNDFSFNEMRNYLY